MRLAIRRAPAWSLLAIAALTFVACDDDDTGNAPSELPLALTCAADPASGPAPLRVTLSVQISGPRPEALGIEYGDGMSGSNPGAAHVYQAPGTYSLTVNASAAGQTASCGVTVTANPPPPAPPNAPPVVRARVNPDPPAGASPFEVHFNMCETLDPDGDPLHFSYDFGDGQARSSDRCLTEHVYAKGSWRATVCATDGVPGHEGCRLFTVAAN